MKVRGLMTRSAFALIATVSTILLAGQPALAARPTPVKEATVIGTGGAAASVDPIATSVAIDILRRGGNAVDAAVAAAAALGVVEPFSCGLGGGGFMVIYSARDGRVFTLDGRETAPSAFRADSFIDPSTGLPISFAEGVTSGLGVGVPGTPRLWAQALARYGTIPLAAALAPSIGIARSGFEIDQTFHDQVASNQDRFKDFSSTRDLYLPGGDAPAVGSIFRNPDLARTYQTLSGHGMDAFYRGDVANAIVNTVQHPPLVPGGTQRAAWVDDGRRSCELPGDLAGADGHPVPRLRNLQHGSAVERRLDGGRGAQDPRGLRPRLAYSGAGALPDAGGVEARVRRSQPVRRRPRLRKRAAAGSAL